MAASATGTINPGDNGTATPTGTLTSGAVTMNANTTFFVNINGPAAGSFDKLVSTGEVALGGATLTGTAGLGVAITDPPYTIISATSVTGTFAGFADGSTVTLSGQKFTIDYTATTVTLTRQLSKTTTTTLTASPDNPVAGQPDSTYGDLVTFTATVAPIDAGTGPPSGSATMTFKDNGVTIPGTPVRTGSTWTLDTRALTGGTHTITAVFADPSNTNLDPSTSDPLTYIVAKKNTTVSIAGSPNPSGNNQPVTFTVTVPGATGTGTSAPTGTVTFTDNGNPMTGTITYSVTPTNVGTWTLTKSLPRARTSSTSPTPATPTTTAIPPAPATASTRKRSSRPAPPPWPRRRTMPLPAPPTPPTAIR